MLKLRGGTAAGDGRCQPGRKPPHDQVHLTQRPHVDLQEFTAFHGWDVSRAAGVVSGGTSAGGQSSARIGGGSETVAWRRRELANARHGTRKRAETTAGFAGRGDS